MKGVEEWGGGGGRNPSPGCSSGSYGLGEPRISLSPYPRLGSSPRKKKKTQFENLLPKEGYTCGRGSGEFGARLWGRGLAGTDGEDLAHVLSSPRGLPDSVGAGGGGGKLERTALSEIL